jgi:2-keto-3-deoxy-L-rhamnonate aldolase RhmA
MTANSIRQAIRAGGTVRGVHLTYPAPRAIEALAGLGLDFVYLDGEHGAFTPGEIEQHCVVADRRGITPIARVPDNSRGTILRFLDRGVRGIIVPHVESVDEARRAVAATYFAPLGERSYGGAFPANYRDRAELPQFLQDCNAVVTLSLMIESRPGLAAAHELAAVDGVDYLSFGMMDLAQSLGRAGRPDHPEVAAAVADASARIRAAGKPVREDFMRFAWIDDILFAGGKARLGLPTDPAIR